MCASNARTHVYLFTHIPCAEDYPVIALVEGVVFQEAGRYAYYRICAEAERRAAVCISHSSLRIIASVQPDACLCLAEKMLPASLLGILRDFSARGSDRFHPPPGALVSKDFQSTQLRINASRVCPPKRIPPRSFHAQSSEFGTLF